MIGVSLSIRSRTIISNEIEKELNSYSQSIELKSNEIIRLEAELKSARQQTQFQAQCLNEIKADLSIRSDELVTVRDELKSKMNELETVKAELDVKINELDTLRNDFNETIKSFNQVKIELNEANSQLANVQFEIESKSKQIRELEKSHANLIETHSQTVDEFKLNMESKSHEHASLTNVLNECKLRHVDELNQMSQRYNDQIEAKQKEIQALSSNSREGMQKFQEEMNKKQTESVEDLKFM